MYQYVNLTCGNIQQYTGYVILTMFVIVNIVNPNITLEQQKLLNLKSKQGLISATKSKETRAENTTPGKIYKI